MATLFSNGITAEVIVFYNVNGINYWQNIMPSNHDNLCFVEEPDTDVNLVVKVTTRKNGLHLNTAVYPYIFGVNVDSKSLLPDNPNVYNNHKGHGIICNNSGLTIDSWITEDNPTIVLTRDKLASVNLAANANSAYKYIALYMFGEKSYGNTQYTTKGISTRGGDLHAGMGHTSGNTYQSVNFVHDNLIPGNFFIGFMPKQVRPQANATTTANSLPRIIV